MQTLRTSFDGNVDVTLWNTTKISHRDLLHVIGHDEFFENTEKLLDSYFTGSTKCCGTGTC